MSPRKVIDWDSAPWRQMIDARIAEVVGSSQQQVRIQRKKRGIERVRIVPKSRDARREYHREYARKVRRVECPKCGSPYTETGVRVDGKRMRRCFTCIPPAKERVPFVPMDLTGKRFGRLVVLSEDAPTYSKSGHRIRRWLCQCDCGELATIRHGNLNEHKQKSCGCLLREYHERKKRENEEKRKR